MVDVPEIIVAAYFTSLTSGAISPCHPARFVLVSAKEQLG